MNFNMVNVQLNMLKNVYWLQCDICRVVNFVTSIRKTYTRTHTCVDALRSTWNCEGHTFTVVHVLNSLTNTLLSTDAVSGETEGRAWMINWECGRKWLWPKAGLGNMKASMEVFAALGLPYSFGNTV
jgi:hypothetical protein